MYYVLHIAGAANITLADFNLAVSTPTAKPPNFKSPPNFPAIRYVIKLLAWVMCMTNKYAPLVFTSEIPFYMA